MKQYYIVKHDSNLTVIPLWHNHVLKQGREDQYRIHTTNIQLMPQQALSLHSFFHIFLTLNVCSCYVTIWPG